MYQLGYNKIGLFPNLGDFIFGGGELLGNLFFCDTRISDRVSEQLRCNRNCRVECGSLVHDGLSGRNALYVSTERLDHLLNIFARLAVGGLEGHAIDDMAQPA